MAMELDDRGDVLRPNREDAYTDQLALKSTEPVNCHACGEKRMCWEIDGSNWEYSGANLCGECLLDMAWLLEDEPK